MLVCDIFIVSQNQGLFFVNFIIPHPLSKKADKKDVRLALGAASDVLQEPCRAAREGLPWG